MRVRIKGSKRLNTSLFDGFIVDKTHGVLVFNHSFDELSFSQSLCREGGGAQVSPRDMDAQCTVCKETENEHDESYLRDPFLTTVCADRRVSAGISESEVVMRVLHLAQEML